MSTLYGYAFSVNYPRRRANNFVTLSAYVVARELQAAHALGWAVSVSLVPFKGEGALSLIVSGTSHFDKVDGQLSEGASRAFEEVDGTLRNY